MLVMVDFFIAFRWIHLSTPLLRLCLLVLILLLMPTQNFYPGWFEFSLLSPLIRFASSSVAPTLVAVFHVSPLFGSAGSGCSSVEVCVSIDVLRCAPCRPFSVCFIVCSVFSATSCRGLVWVYQVIHGL